MVNRHERMTLNFDLFQDKLIQYGFKDPKKAYGMIYSALGDEYEYRMQSSVCSINSKGISDIQVDVLNLLKKLPWLAACVNHFTATAESAVLDMNPYFKGQLTRQDFLNFENQKGVIQEPRAIHFDLYVKEVDKHFNYRSEPYYQIKKEAKKLGYEWQQGSGYASTSPKTAQEFIDDIYTLMNNIPNLQNVIKQVDATYLKNVYDITPFIKNNNMTSGFGNTITSTGNNISSKSTARGDLLNAKEPISIKDLVNSVLKLARGLTIKDTLMYQTFSHENNIYEIKDLSIDKTKRRVDAIIENTKTKEMFLEKNFAGSNPFKLGLNQPVKNTSFAMNKASKMTM